MLDIPIGVDHQTATLAGLVRALEQTRTQGRSKAVGYLEAVADDVVFEMESAARRSQFKVADRRQP